jgi:quercetin dioxygenase-like cupin family protein
MADLRVDLEAIPWESPMPGLRFKACRTGGKQLRLVEFDKEFVEPDWCAKGHYGYVMEGEFEIDFNGEVLTFKKGDGVFIPPGEASRHKARALTDTARFFFVEDV